MAEDMLEKEKREAAARADKAVSSLKRIMDKVNNPGQHQGQVSNMSPLSDCTARPSIITVDEVCNASRHACTRPHSLSPPSHAPSYS